MVEKRPQVLFIWQSLQMDPPPNKAQVVAPYLLVHFIPNPIVILLYTLEDNEISRICKGYGYALNNNAML